MTYSDKAILMVKQHHRVERSKKALKQAQTCFSQAMQDDLEATLSIEQTILIALENELQGYPYHV